MDHLTQGFQLEGLRVEPLTGEVAGPGGTAKVDPRVMDVLVLMAGRPGQVVRREDLVTRIWGHAVVTDDAVTRCFYELRRHLAQAGGDERFRELIETVPKRGYRLNATVIPGLPAAATPKMPEPPAPGAPKRAWAAVAGAAAVVLAIGAAILFGRSNDEAGTPATKPAMQSIAVLPFADMSEAGDQRHFSDGISEEILNRLAQSPGLRVISRTSSFSFRDESIAIPEIADKLDVSHVLEGSVRRSEDRVRITAQLIDVSTNAHVWSDTYDRDPGDIFAVQDDIAAKVAAALHARLSAMQAVAPDPAAFERYLKGRFFYNRRGPGDLALMAKYLAEAVAVDPGFARAWAELAGAYHLLAFEQPGAAAAWRTKQAGAARKALELDPGLAPAHLRLAQYYWRSADPAQGDTHFQKAIALDPNDVLLLSMRAGRAASSGDAKAAVEFQRKAVARDPLSSVQHNNLASYLRGAEQYEESLAESRIGYELNPVSDAADAAERVRLLVLLGRIDETPEIVATMPDGAYRDFALALIDEPPARKPEADAALERLAAGPPVVEDVLLAEVYAHRGMSDLAFGAVERMREAFQQDAVADAEQEFHLRQKLHLSPFLRPLHADPRWKALIAELGGS